MENIETINLIENSKNKTFVEQKGNKIKCDHIFTRLEELYKEEVDKPYEERSTKSKIFNRFSGNYFSPTFVKSFMQCPAKAFISNCMPKETSEILNFGSCTHKVFENIIKEGCWSDEKKCFDIAETEANNYSIIDSNRKILKETYLPNFLNSNDYLNKNKKFPWDDVQCFTESFYKADLSIFDVPLGSCFTLMDRLDIRDEGIFVIDYKTGKAPFNSRKMSDFIDSYINQMTCYYWMIEKQFGIKPRCFAYLPDNNTYVEFNVQSLKTQSMFVEEVLEYYKDVKSQREAFEFEERVNKYCKYCPICGKCNAFSKLDNDGKIDIDLNKL